MNQAAFVNPVDPVLYSELSPAEQERILHLQQAVLEQVALGKDHIRIIENICLLGEKAVPNSIGTCMLLDENGEQLNILAAPNVPPEGIASLNGLCPGPGGGSCGNAVFRKEPVFVENTFVDPRWRDIRHLAHAFNIHACWSMPVRDSGGDVIGSFALSSFEHRPPSLFHRKLLDICAHLIGIVLARQKSEERIAFLASHDVLTGLPSRPLARDRLEQAAARSRREGTAGAVLFIDLDNFKLINDSLGHETGDKLLQRIAEQLKQRLRATDSISRYGGDEFLVILEDIGDTDAISNVAESLVECAQAPFDIDGHTLTASVSIGIAVFPADGSSPDTLLRKADAALYHAKDIGRNAYRFYTEQMNVDSAEHLQLRTDMRQALDQRQFVLHYQPQIDLADGSVTGVEALVRWQHPELGLVPPGRFIAIAEACGLIVPLGEWIVGEACRQAVAWQKTGLPPVVMAVNFSALQFRRGNLEEAICRALGASGLAPEWLELELTESILLQDTAHMLQLIQRLKALGVKLSIDDFGTGYSSLAYLRRLAVDKLKIDQSFVRGMMEDADNASIVRAIIQMARSLHLSTVAEGVEDADMLAPLVEYGCDQAQGYHFARPMPAEDCAEFLRRNAALQKQSC